MGPYKLMLYSSCILYRVDLIEKPVKRYPDTIATCPSQDWCVLNPDLLT